MGLDVLGQQTGNQWSYFGYDGLGSVRQVMDAAGQVQSQASFDPYGDPFEQFGSQTASALGFTGEQTDPNGLVYLRARYLNPQLGAFTSLDPFEGYMIRAMSRNGYSYAEDNPVNYTDPSGKIIPLLIGAAILGAAIGAGVGAGIEYGQQVAHNLKCGMDLFHAGYYKNLDLGRIGEAALRGGIVGAVAGVVGAATVATGGAALGALGITSGSGLAASVGGAAVVGVSGVVGGQFARATENVLSARKFDVGLLRPEDVLLDAVLSIGFFKAFGGHFNEIAPRPVRQLEGDPSASLRLRRAWFASDEIQFPEKVRQLLEPIYQKYPPSSFKCNYCADEAMKVFTDAGYNAEIVGLRDVENAPNIELNHPPLKQRGLQTTTESGDFG